MTHPIGKPRGRSTHVCFLSPYLWPVLAGDRSIEFAGGAELRQSILARALVRAGYHVSVVTLDFGQVDGGVVDGVEVLRTHRPAEGVPLLRFFYPRLSSWWAAMRRADADIYFQSCAAHLTAVTGLFTRHHGRRFIYSGAHDLDFQPNDASKLFQRPGGWRDRQLYQWGLTLADGIVAQHPGQVAACRRWYGREAVEIPNCYAPPVGAVAARKGVVLWVATVKSLKRPELFLELAQSLPQLRFRMVGGPGPGREAEVYKLARQMAAGLPNVEFVGFVPFAEVETHFDAARLFVNTSDYEGFANTFLQSWARGVPTVSFVDCGAREGGRPVGFVCRDLTEMRQVVLRLAEDDATWAAEGQRAKTYFEANHSVAMAVERYDRLFEQVLAKGRRGW